MSYIKLYDSGFINIQDKLKSLEVISNDYFGMAQDLKRMRETYARFYNWKMIPFESSKFYMAVKEFEEYCLDQPYE